MSLTVLKVSRDPRTGDQFTATLNTQTYVVDMQLTDSYTVQFSDATATPLDCWVANDGTTRIPPVGSLYAVRGTPTVLTYVSIVPRRDPGNPCVWRVQVQAKNIIPQPPADQQ